MACNDCPSITPACEDPTPTPTPSVDLDWLDDCKQEVGLIGLIPPEPPCEPEPTDCAPSTVPLYSCTRSKNYKKECETGCTGTTVTYTRTATGRSMEEACQKAQDLVDNAALGQAYANSIGSCNCDGSFRYNWLRCENFQRSCPDGTQGSTVQYCEKYYSNVSVADAKAIALADTGFEDRGREYAKFIGDCDREGECPDLTQVGKIYWEKLPDGNCETTQVEIIASETAVNTTPNGIKDFNFTFATSKSSTWKVSSDGGVTWQPAGTGFSVTFASNAVGWFFLVKAENSNGVGIYRYQINPVTSARIFQRAGGWELTPSNCARNRYRLLLPPSVSLSTVSFQRTGDVVFKKIDNTTYEISGCRGELTGTATIACGPNTVTIPVDPVKFNGTCEPCENCPCNENTTVEFLWIPTNNPNEWVLFAIPTPLFLTSGPVWTVTNGLEILGARNRWAVVVSFGPLVNINQAQCITFNAGGVCGPVSKNDCTKKTVPPSVTPTPTPSPSPSASASGSASPSPSPSPSPTPSLSEGGGGGPSESPSASPGASPSPTPSLSEGASPSASPNPSPSPTPSLSEGASPSASASPGASPSPTPSLSEGASPSASPNPSPSPTPSLSEGASPSASAEPSPSPTPSLSEGASPSASASPGASPSPTPSLSEGASPSASPNPSPSPTPSLSEGASPSASPGPSPSPSPSPSPPPSLSEGVVCTKYLISNNIGSGATAVFEYQRFPDGVVTEESLEPGQSVERFCLSMPLATEGVVTTDDLGACVESSPSPSPSASDTPTPTPSVSPSPSASASVSASPSASASRSPSPTPTPSPSPSLSACKATGACIVWRSSNASYVPFASHSAAALGACNTSGSGTIGWISNGVTVGSTIYWDIYTGNCNTLPAGYYYLRNPPVPCPSNNPPEGLICSTVRLDANGVILEVQPYICTNCTYGCVDCLTGPSPSPSASPSPSPSPSVSVSPSASPSPTPTPSPSLGACGGFFIGDEAISGYYVFPEVTVDVSASGSMVTVAWTAHDNPNRFSIYDEYGTLLATSGWVGTATEPGPWGSTLSTSNTGIFPFTKTTNTVYLRVETLKGTPSAANDAWEVYVNCTSPGG